MKGRILEGIQAVLAEKAQGPPSATNRNTLQVEDDTSDGKRSTPLAQSPGGQAESSAMHSKFGANGLSGKT